MNSFKFVQILSVNICDFVDLRNLRPLRRHELLINSKRFNSDTNVTREQRKINELSITSTASAIEWSARWIQLLMTLLAI